MSALNDSRKTIDSRQWRVWHDESPSHKPTADNANDPDSVDRAEGHQRAGGSESDAGFSVERQVTTIRDVLQRHERQIQSLQHDKHEHCANLETVYKELERVLEKMQLPSLARASFSLEDERAGSMAAAVLPEGAVSGRRKSSGRAAEPQQGSSPSVTFVSDATFRKVEKQLNALLTQHRDQVFDVLADHRRQIDQSGRETRQRLEAVETSVTQLQSEVRQLRELVASMDAERRSVHDRLREELRSLAKEHAEHKDAVEQQTTEHAEKVQQCCDTLSACLTQLRADTKAIKKQQQSAEEEFARQVRSIVSTEQQVAEVLERQSQSLAQLQTQDSLESAFHEVKDWLGDLEKRMVSRGELLQWTESLQQEMHKLRRVVAPGVAAVAADSA